MKLCHGDLLVILQKVITREVERDSLEEMFNIKYTVTPPFQDLYLVVETLYKTACVTVLEVMGYFMFVLSKRLYKFIKTCCLAAFDSGYPLIYLFMRLFNAKAAIENAR